MKKTPKKAGALLLSAALLLSFPGCHTDTPDNISSAEASASPEISVDRTISVTIPEAVLRLTDADMPAMARRLGLDNVTDNDDGSCTVCMTAEEQETILSTLRESLDSQLAALPESGTWPFIDSIELNSTCTEVTIHSEKDRYSPVRDNTMAQTVYIPALLYTAFSGGDTEAFSLHFTVLDADGKTALGEFDYPAPEPEVSADEEPSGNEPDEE